MVSVRKHFVGTSNSLHWKNNNEKVISQNSLKSTRTPFVTQHNRFCIQANGLSVLFPNIGRAQFSSGWYWRIWKSPYALHPVSQKFPHCCVWTNSSVVWLMMALSCPSVEAPPLLMPPSSKRPMEWQNSLCLQVVSLSPLHLCFEMQAIYGCFGHQPTSFCHFHFFIVHSNFQWLQHV